jgi:hypothetical protein
MTTRLMAAATSNGGGDGRKRGGGGKERCNNQIEATAGRVASRGHSQIAILKISTLCLYKMRWYHVLRGEVHKNVLSVLAASDPLLVSEEKASRKMI